MGFLSTRFTIDARTVALAESRRTPGLALEFLTYFLKNDPF
jgi:hypothetical protein